MRRLDEIELAPRDRAAIEEAARILRARLPVEQIVLFGSKARGDDRPDSDVDLLVLTRDPVSRPGRHSARHALRPVEERHGVFLSLLVVPAVEWREGMISVLPIHREVEEQGAAA